MQSQKMESVGRLAGGVAHDFNNLLTVINGYASLMLRKLHSEDPLRDHVAEIRKAGERAAGLTQQLLTISRRQIVQLRPLNLSALIEESQGMLGRMLGEDVQIAAELDMDAGLVLADGDQLHQTLMNLAVNARDAMPQGGHLTLRTSRLHLDKNSGARYEATPGDYVLLEVCDTGVGISEEDQQRIFEPFFTTKGRVGTGLGLPTVLGIVQQTGGWIAVDSRLGEGTTFRIGLPLLPATALPTPPDGSTPTDLEGSETVLVVEDQEEVRNLAVLALRSFGYRTLEAESGDAALQLVEGHAGPIHLVLTDVVMPA